MAQKRNHTHQSFPMWTVGSEALRKRWSPPEAHWLFRVATEDPAQRRAWSRAVPNTWHILQVRKTRKRIAAAMTETDPGKKKKEIRHWEEYAWGEQMAQHCKKKDTSGISVLPQHCASGAHQSQDPLQTGTAGFCPCQPSTGTSFQNNLLSTGIPPVFQPWALPSIVPISLSKVWPIIFKYTSVYYYSPCSQETCRAPEWEGRLRSFHCL